MKPPIAGPFCLKNVISKKKRKWSEFKPQTEAIPNTSPMRPKALPELVSSQTSDKYVLATPMFPFKIP